MNSERISVKDFVEIVKEGLEGGAEVSIEIPSEDVYDDIIDISLVGENTIQVEIENEEGDVEKRKLKLKSVETADYNDFCDSFDIVLENGENYVINICE